MYASVSGSMMVRYDFDSSISPRSTSQVNTILWTFFVYHKKRTEDSKFFVSRQPDRPSDVRCTFLRRVLFRSFFFSRITYYYGIACRTCLVLENCCVLYIHILLRVPRAFECIFSYVCLCMHLHGNVILENWPRIIRGGLV